jgi:hypothetical protein
LAPLPSKVFILILGRSDTAAMPFLVGSAMAHSPGAQLLLVANGFELCPAEQEQVARTVAAGGGARFSYLSFPHEFASFPLALCTAMRHLPGSDGQGSGTIVAVLTAAFSLRPRMLRSQAVRSHVPRDLFSAYHLLARSHGREGGFLVTASTADAVVVAPADGAQGAGAASGEVPAAAVGWARTAPLPLLVFDAATYHALGPPPPGMAWQGAAAAWVHRLRRAGASHHSSAVGWRFLAPPQTRPPPQPARGGGVDGGADGGVNGGVNGVPADAHEAGNEREDIAQRDADALFLGLHWQQQQERERRAAKQARAASRQDMREAAGGAGGAGAADGAGGAGGMDGGDGAGRGGVAGGGSGGEEAAHTEHAAAEQRFLQEKVGACGLGEEGADQSQKR